MKNDSKILRHPLTGLLSRLSSLRVPRLQDRRPGNRPSGPFRVARPWFLLPGCLLLPLGWCQILKAEVLYGEGFDSVANAKVVLNLLADAGVEFVDYSNVIRDQPGGGGAVTVRVPEAPNRLPGTAATRGVLLYATYGGTARTANLLAAAAAGGAPREFTGNFRMSFDLWLSTDLTNRTATTEVALYGIGQGGTGTISYARRAAGSGTFGWIAPDGGIAATTGDISLYSGSTEAFKTENFSTPLLFASAFPQGTPEPNNPNNQWSQVEVLAVNGEVTVFLNGVRFGSAPAPTPVNGFAALGYEDPFIASIPGALNRSFALFDNWKVETLPGSPSLETGGAPSFARVTEADGMTEAELAITNMSTAAAFNLTGAAISGTHAADFSLATAFPAEIPAGGVLTVPVGFKPSTPNGLKVALLTLVTSDPNQPEIRIPLQATRLVNSLELTVSSRIGTVTVQNGSNTGAITITNNGSAEASVSAPVLTGSNAADFTLPAAYPVLIPPAESVVIPVNFVPTGGRGLKSATVEFPTTDPGVPLLSRGLLSRYAFGPPLLAHYRMDDVTGTSLADSSGEAIPAGLQIREAPFEFSQPSLLPNGAGTSVRLKPADTSTTGNYAVSNVPHLPNVSFSFWIRPEAKTSSGNRRILMRSSLFTLNGTLYSLFLTPEGNLAFAVNSSTASENIVVETGDGALVDGVTYHVAVTHLDANGFGDGNDVTATRTRLYLNGALVAESAEPVAGFTDYLLTTTTEGLYIGTSTSAGQGFLGAMDDLQIYSVELSQSEVAGLFAQPGRTVAELAPSDFQIRTFAVNPAAGTASITFNAVSGSSYVVQTASDPAVFADLPGVAPVLATGPDATVSFPASALPRQFFRIRRLP